MDYNKIVKCETGDDQNTSVTENSSSGNKTDVQFPSSETKIVQLKLRKLLCSSERNTNVNKHEQSPVSTINKEVQCHVSSSSLVPVQSDGKTTFILKPSDYLSGGHFTRGAKRNVESSLAKNAVVQTFPAVKAQTRIINADSCVASSRSFDASSPQIHSAISDSHKDLKHTQLTTDSSGEITTLTTTTYGDPNKDTTLVDTVKSVECSLFQSKNVSSSDNIIETETALSNTNQSINNQNDFNQRDHNNNNRNKQATNTDKHLVNQQVPSQLARPTDPFIGAAQDVTGDNYFYDCLYDGDQDWEMETSASLLREASTTPLARPLSPHLTPSPSSTSPHLIIGPHSTMSPHTMSPHPIMSPHPMSLAPSSILHPTTSCSVTIATAAQDHVLEGTTPTCLLIRHETCSDDFRQELAQALQTPSVRVVTFSAAPEVCDSAAYTLIWAQFDHDPGTGSLGVLAYIRYSSKKNKNAYVIAIANKPFQIPSGDAATSGIDEVLVHPVSRYTIRQKCHMLGWVVVGGTETLIKPGLASPGSTHSAQSLDSTRAHYSPSSTYGGVDPRRPVSVASSSRSQESKDSIHSMSSMGSIDSINSRDSMETRASISSITSRPIRDRYHINSPGHHSPAPSWCRLEHATKEKQRRERIKDSCDQLRVLLPYVRGRKTDMASILEMTVDYLKVVSSALPQEVQTQIIEVMGSGPVVEDDVTEEDEPRPPPRKLLRRRRTEGGDKLAKMRMNKRKSDRKLSKVASQSLGLRMSSGGHGGHITMTSEVHGGHKGPKPIGTALLATATKTLANLANLKQELPAPRPPTGPSRIRKSHLARALTSHDPLAPPIVYMQTASLAPGKERQTSMAHSATLQPSLVVQGVSEGHVATSRMLYPGGMVVSAGDPFFHTAGGPARIGSDLPQTNVNAFSGIYALEQAHYQYYQSLQDANNGSVFPPGDAPSEYVNPNMVMPVQQFVNRAYVGQGQGGRRSDGSGGTHETG